MTLRGLLSPTSPQPGPQVLEMDRTEWIAGGGGGWKAGKGNPNTSLSALTLLAFLFFLNILQSCLKDTIGQNSGVMVMMLPTTTEATVRRKRAQPQPPAHWTDSQITEIVHNQIQLYWGNNEERPIYTDRIKPLEEINPKYYKNTMDNTKYRETISPHTKLANVTNKRISTTLNRSEKSMENDKLDNRNQEKKSDHSSRQKLSRGKVEIKLNSLTSKQKQPNHEIPQWKNTVNRIYNTSKSFLENKCCQIIKSWSNKPDNGAEKLKHYIAFIRQTAHWICSKLFTEKCESARQNRRTTTV